MEKLVLNGTLVDRGEASVDIEDRGYQFGDGIYEVVRVYGGRLFTSEMHLKRLYSSAEKLSLHIPYTMEQLTAQLEALVAANQLHTGIVYLQFTRGVAKRKHHFPETSETTFVAYTSEVERPLEKMRKGVKAVLAEDIRWLRCDIKSLNLLGNVLAKQKAAENGAYEAIQHRGETVTEGSSSNVFIVKDGVLLTHPATNLILNGITRQVVFGICGKEGIPFREEPFTVEDLCTADEVLITSTTSEVMPVVDIDGKPVAGGTPGTVTLKLQHAFDREIHALSAQAVPGAQN